ncbi:hypothetical protein ATANTOWER_032969 [Ataeniobius toweri]|uniref:Uncharacterized protein n=1 Tax=Ataeniobius toweri TaxID=208326 RepID=A0ABU7AWT2_9TELE|nr:hypothetical protein [Ataeniobius toweri]
MHCYQRYTTCPRMMKASEPLLLCFSPRISPSSVIIRLFSKYTNSNSPQGVKKYQERKPQQTSGFHNTKRHFHSEKVRRTALLCQPRFWEIGRGKDRLPPPSVWERELLLGGLLNNIILKIFCRDKVKRNTK